MVVGEVGNKGRRQRFRLLQVLVLKVLEGGLVPLAKKGPVGLPLAGHLVQIDRLLDVHRPHSGQAAGVRPAAKQVEGGAG